MSPGGVTCIPSGTVYAVASQDPGKHWCIHYHDTLSKDADAIELPSHFHLGANSLFYREQIQYINRLCRSHEVSQAAELMKLEACYRFKALLLGLHNLAASKTVGRRSRNNFSWDNLLEWVDENLDRPIAASTLAERANLEPGTLARKFKQMHKTTFSQYLLHRRIEKAKSLLATTMLTIYEVGSTIGISDPQYFNKQFRKVTGISPSRYRDVNQEYLSNIRMNWPPRTGNGELTELSKRRQRASVRHADASWQNVYATRGTHRRRTT